MAGQDLLRTNVDTCFGVTQFLIETIKTFHGSTGLLNESLSFMNDKNERQKPEECDQFGYGLLFSHAIKICFLIERKLAQCHFHLNKGQNRAKKILDMLTGGIESYTSDLPAEYPKMNSFEYSSLCFELANQWFLDMTKVVDALFEANLATVENLTTLFGRSSYVSCRIYELHQCREERRQQIIYRL